MARLLPPVGFLAKVALVGIAGAIGLLIYALLALLLDIPEVRSLPKLLSKRMRK